MAKKSNTNAISASSPTDYPPNQRVFDFTTNYLDRIFNWQRRVLFNIKDLWIRELVSFHSKLSNVGEVSQAVEVEEKKENMESRDSSFQ